MPDLRGHRPRGGPVVPGEQHRRQPELAELGDRRGGGRLDRVGDHQHPAGPAVPADRDGRTACRPRPRRRPGRALRERQAALAKQAARPTSDGVPVDRRPGRRAPRGWRTRSPAAGRRPGRGPPAAMARAIGCSEACSTAPASRSTSSASSPSAASTSAQGHHAGGDRAGLVQHDGVDRPGGLQGLRALDQDAQLGAAAGADHQGRRRGQAEGARAGDDQHGDRGGERGGGAGPGAEPEPERGHRRVR